MNTTPLANINLHDIHAAPPPAFWPPAPGWWILAIIILSVLAVISWRLIRNWHQRRQHARIMQELDALANDTPEKIATKISILLRRVALMRYPRKEVAPLNGQAWLAFLDRTGGNGDFTSGVGSILAIAPYIAIHKLKGFDKDALLILSRNWLQQNLRRPA